MTIEMYYKKLKSLHGMTTSEEEIIKIIADDMGYSEHFVKHKIIDINLKINSSEGKEYGLVIGRFQPFHYGHQYIINEILLDGRIPIIILGDDQGRNPKKNPLTFEQRRELIRLIYPNTEIVFLSVKDNPDWSLWFDDIGHAVIGDSGRVKEEVVLYYNNKEVDRYDHFEVYGKTYINEFYTEIFEDNGIKTRQVEFVERNDIHIDADGTNIRDDLEAFKHLLDARVYWKLKEYKW